MKSLVVLGAGYGDLLTAVKLEGKLALTVKKLIHLHYVYQIAGLGQVLGEAV